MPKYYFSTNKKRQCGTWHSLVSCHHCHDAHTRSQFCADYRKLENQPFEPNQQVDKPFNCVILTYLFSFSFSPTTPIPRNEPLSMRASHPVFSSHPHRNDGPWVLKQWRRLDASFCTARGPGGKLQVRQTTAISKRLGRCLVG